MHEASVAQGLVEVIVQEAERQQGRPIRAKMSCGELNKLNDDVLLFAFEAVAQGTPCEGMTLEIEHKPLLAKCRTCGVVYAVDMANTQCPGCGGGDFELLPDAPLVLDEIEFERADDEEG